MIDIALPVLRAIGHENENTNEKAICYRDPDTLVVDSASETHPRAHVDQVRQSILTLFAPSPSVMAFVPTVTS